MDEATLLHSLETQSQVSFSRSSGPGGQNVNKVNSKVLLRVSLTQLEGLTTDERRRLILKLQGRLNDEGELAIQVQDERSQLLNRDLAVKRILGLIVRSLKRDKPRHDTRPTRASKERRLTAKKAHSQRKAQRGGFNASDL